MTSKTGDCLARVFSLLRLNNGCVGGYALGFFRPLCRFLFFFFCPGAGVVALRFAVAVAGWGAFGGCVGCVLFSGVIVIVWVCVSVFGGSVEKRGVVVSATSVGCGSVLRLMLGDVTVVTRLAFGSVAGLSAGAALLVVVAVGVSGLSEKSFARLWLPIS